jgi:hypothetical protein
MKEESITKPRNAEELYRKYQELYPEQFLNDLSCRNLINPPLKGTSLMLDPRLFPKTHQRRQRGYPHDEKR